MNEQISNGQTFWGSLQQSITGIFSPNATGADGLSGMADWYDWFWALANLELILQIVLVFGLLLLGRYIYDLVTPFSLAEVLTTRDNKALSVSFGCYLGGLAIVIVGVYSSPSSSTLAAEVSYWKSLLYNLSDTFFWGVIAICLLLLAQILNNHFILSRFDNYRQIVERRNLAVGVAEGASYIASALLIYGVMQGANEHFLLDILLTLFYFVLGQAALILYTRIFIAVRRKVWDFHREMAQQNVAAALSFAFSLISFALIISAYIANFFSIYGLLLSAILSIIYLFLLHILIDKLFFPKVPLHGEIAQDQNWGATLIEGFLLLGLSVVGVVAFSAYVVA
ncbi:DUF350 domain-containing protein [Candidatus Haliotispira prima]|uniref:DUF350 domain-containing protein n=1 Tax=Candidatus Haliotispira prima TaxID=3034016 RepID=A0ABY8MJC0_9SPIO|nr:DUF350 domain-containing protein [Candidatus Haliotispira prima]